jgi:hypothetical protein
VFINIHRVSHLKKTFFYRRLHCSTFENTCKAFVNEQIGSISHQVDVQKIHQHTDEQLLFNISLWVVMCSRFGFRITGADIAQFSRADPFHLINENKFSQEILQYTDQYKSAHKLERKPLGEEGWLLNPEMQIYRINLATHSRNKLQCKCEARYSTPETGTVGYWQLMVSSAQFGFGLLPVDTAFFSVQKA